MLPPLLWNSQRAWDECGQSARERSEKGVPLRSVKTRLPKINPTRRSGAAGGVRGPCVCTEKEEQPSTLNVLEIEQSAALLCGGPGFGLNILLVADWDAQQRTRCCVGRPAPRQNLA